MKISSKSTFEIAPAGNHLAVTTIVADLGLHETSWNGDTRYSRKLGITYELAGKKTSKGTPFAVFDIVNAFLYEKARLYEVVQAALGSVPEDLDPKDLLGKAVLVQVFHRTDGNRRTWANVKAVTPVPYGTKATSTKTPLLYFDLEQPDPEVFEKLPALFRKLIEQRVQEAKRSEPEQPDSDFDEDISF